MKGSIKQRSPGSWQLRYDLPRGEDGKRRPVTVTMRGTKKQAQAELARLLHQVETGIYAAPGRMTLGDYLDRWVTEYIEAHWTAQGVRTCKSHIRNHLKPALGHLQLSRLMPLHVQGYYTQKRKEGLLSEQTLLHHHRILVQSLRQAVRWQLLSRSPMEGVTAPSPRPQEPHAFTEEQVRALLAAHVSPQLHLAILLALSTGMRRGEVVGLRWQDVDLKAGTLVVRQAVTENGHTKAPKTRQSRRAIALPSLLVDALTRHRAQQEAERRMIDPEWGKMRINSPTSNVLSWADGRPFRLDYITRMFGRLATKLGLPSTRFHDLRHTHATLLMEEGIHPKVVSERLGHANVQLTLDRYTHGVPGLQEEAARRVDGALRSAFEVE